MAITSNNTALYLKQYLHANVPCLNVGYVHTCIVSHPRACINLVFDQIDFIASSYLICTMHRIYIATLKIRSQLASCIGYSV